MNVSDLPREIQPPVDLWPGIAVRIRRRPAALALPAWALAAAAVALIALSSGVTAYLLRGPAGSGVATGVRPLPAHLVTLERQYAGAAGEIERVIRSHRASLTPEAVAAVERSLRVIDEAMREARAALTRDPENATLQQLFWATHEQKLDLLQRAARLSEKL